MADPHEFDGEWANAAEWANMYRALGLQVVPAYKPGENTSYKRPIINWKEWENTLTPDGVFEKWYGRGGQYLDRMNMGFVTGVASGGVFCVDLDVNAGSQSMQWWAGLVALHNNNQEPDTPAQRTGGGGRQILFRAPAGYSPPTFKTSIGIDIRGQGGFMMAPPSRHASGKDYEWEEGRAPYEVEIEEAPDWLLEAIDALRLEHGGNVVTQRERTDATGAKNDFGLDSDDRELKLQRAVWGRVVDMYRDCPIKPSQSEQEAALRDLWTWYLSTTATRLAARDGMDKADLLEMEGRGWSELQRKWRYAMNKWDKEVRDAAAIPQERAVVEKKPVEVVEPEPSRIMIEHAVERFTPRGFTGEVPPPRPWAYGNFLMYGAVTGVAAPPGVGKTTFSVQLGIAFSRDMTFGQWGPVPGGGGRVWLYNGEEPQDELDRRFMASCAEHGIQDHEGAERFFYNSGLDERLQFVRVDPNTKEIQRHPDTDKIISIIKQHDIRLFIVDPLIEFNGATEDGEGLKAAGTVLREIATACQCAVLFFHHTPKTANSDTAAGDMNSLRGGGQIVGSARFVSTMFAMSAKDAEEYNVPKNERHKYVRFDDAKANMTVMSGDPQWWVKLGVGIGNEDSVRPADNIGVLRPVALTRDGDEESMERTMARASAKEMGLDKIAAEMARVCVNNGNTSPERAESFDVLIRALDTVRTGVSVNTAKDQVIGGMGTGRVTGDYRVVISSVPRGKLTVRKVHVEPAED